MPESNVFETQHFGRRIGFGARPALVIVDFTVGFNDPAIFGGGNISEAVGNTIGLLSAARQARLPVVHTLIEYASDGSDANVHTLKVPRLLRLTRDNPATHFVPELTPLPGEVVVRKRLPSAFFGTDLAGILMAKGVDTIIVAGCTTSGCVRATALDGMCHGFRPIVVRECVGDRAEAPHRASLFDLDQKYADVMSLAEVLDRIAAPPPAQAHLSATKG